MVPRIAKTNWIIKKNDRKRLYKPLFMNWVLIDYFSGVGLYREWYFQSNLLYLSRPEEAREAVSSLSVLDTSAIRREIIIMGDLFVAHDCTALYLACKLVRRSLNLLGNFYDSIFGIYIEIHSRLGYKYPRGTKYLRFWA